VKHSNSGTGIAKAKSFVPGFLGLAVCVAAVVIMVGNVRADIMCSWFVQCFYQSPGFKIRVVDKETGKPLADIHALAEWIQYGMHGQYPGLMAQDAVSGTDGWLVFPPWGPIRGSSGGLRPSQDPEITLYKIGYQVTTLINRVEQSVQYDRARGFAQNGQSFAVGTFGGNWDERVKQLFEARGRGAPTYKESIELFGEPYLNRWRRVRSEMQLQPQRYESQLFGINRSIKFLEEAKR
jgi:hypothetical protein